MFRTFFINSRFVLFLFVFFNFFTNLVIASTNIPLGRYILIGAPGSGKGTLAQAINENNSLPIVGMSNLLKVAVKEDNETSNKIKKLMAKGSFVDDTLIWDLLSNELKKDKYKNGYILDGFPRTLKQAKFLENSSIVIDALIHVDVSDEDIIERMQGRLVHEPSGRTYHITYSPPKEEGKDDVTGELLIVREDDKPEIVKERLAAYHKITAPVLLWAKNQQSKPDGMIKKIIKVDGTLSIEKEIEIIKDSF